METIPFVMTAADHWTLNDGTKHPTGFWAEEFLAPYAPLPLADVDVSACAAVYYPGGHGPMEDLAGDPDSTRLIPASSTELLRTLKARP